MSIRGQRAAYKGSYLKQKEKENLKCYFTTLPIALHLLHYTAIVIVLVISCTLYNEIHTYIYKFNPTTRVTPSSCPTREAKHQVGMVLLRSCQTSWTSNLLLKWQLIVLSWWYYHLCKRSSVKETLHMKTIISLQNLYWFDRCCNNFSEWTAFMWLFACRCIRWKSLSNLWNVFCIKCQGYQGWGSSSVHRSSQPWSCSYSYNSIWYGAGCTWYTPANSLGTVGHHSSVFPRKWLLWMRQDGFSLLNVCS